MATSRKTTRRAAAPKPQAAASAQAKPAAADQDNAAADDDEGRQPHLRVTGPKAGRWRAGVKFSTKPTIFTRPTSIDEVRKHIAILADPALVCIFVDADGNETTVDADELASHIAELEAEAEAQAGE